jgi:peptidoglycan L-alanyl-D-glutamate endopeptidase CwlK
VSWLSRLLANLGFGLPQAPAAQPVVPPGAIRVSTVGEAPSAPSLPVVGGLMVGDRTRLVGVHLDLVRVVERARRDHAFFVIEGRRTVERQRELVASGASRTMASRHITGHAVDLAPVPLDWSNFPAFRAMAGAVLRAADAEGVPVDWGGNWASFRDGPHFELRREKYPG